MSKVIAIANQKGGVGKTMTSVSLSACLALNNKKVLLLDLDPQGHSTKAFGFYDRTQYPLSMKDVIVSVIEDIPLDREQLILHSNENVDIVPSNISLAGINSKLESAMCRETVLKRFIDTVKDDYDDQERKYDISKAEVTKDFPLSEGDWVDLTVPANTTEDPIPAIAMEVTASMLEQSMDPVADGTVKDVASDSITLEVDGEDYKVLTGNAYVVGKDGIQTGAAAEVTYLGDLDDEPLAIKIVMDDAKDTDEAQIDAFVGKVAQLGEDGDHIVLEAQTGDFFTFVSDSIDLSQYAEGDTLQIQYDGSINDKEIKAVKITKK